MSKNSTLETALAECVALGEEGAALRGLVKLAIYLHGVDANTYRIAVVRMQAVLTAVIIETAVREAAGAVSRARKILSVGTKFEWEEIVLVLTIRTEVDAAASVLSAFGIHKSSLHLADFDDELREIARSKENARTFASALVSIRRNWSMPITNQWCEN